MTDGARRCLFCDSGGTMTREHIFADWINDVIPTEEKHKFTAGPFNRLPRDFGTGPAFVRTVKEVCASCNNGWMSSLESEVRPALAPLMQGQRRLPAPDTAPAVGRWILKTSMMALRMSIAEDRAEGYGLPPEEFHELYEHRSDGRPVDRAQFWVGRYDGDLQGTGTWTLPIVVSARGIEQPTYPHGYVTTLLIGKLVLVGVKFTDPDFVTKLDIPDLWPLPGRNTPAESEPLAPLVDDDLLRHVLRVEAFTTQFDDLIIAAWREALDVEESELEGDVVIMPAMCGKHDLRYPARLAEMGMAGTYATFTSSCECSAYLLQTTPYSVKVVDAGEPEQIIDLYENLPGNEFQLEDSNGIFFYKTVRS